MKGKCIFPTTQNVIIKPLSHVGHMTPILLTSVCPALANHLYLPTGKQGTKESMPNEF